MMKPKFGTPEYRLEEAKKNIDMALEQVSKIRDDVGTIMPVEIIQYKGLYNLDQYYKGSYYSGRFDENNRSHVENAYDNAIKIIDERMASDDEIHEKNLPALLNNLKTKDKIIDFMTSVGISPKYTSWEYPTSRSKNKKSIDKSSGYMSDIEHMIKTSDSYEIVKRQYEEAKKRFKEQYDKMIANIALKEKEAEKEAKKEEDRQALARFQVKYENNGDWDDILDVILSKNKYLHLGHYLLMNRNDWTDGCKKAQYGLGGFVVETPVDKDIETEISGLIENWDGDGRCFRDSCYGYDFLFSLVDGKLLHDYDEVCSKIDFY